jgi:DNA polymerase-3 subunit delta'
MIDFEKILGQEKPIQILKNIIKYNRIGHAYLFTGEEGIGKKMAAIAFAKAINCTNLSENQNSCNKCASCLKVERAIHPDFSIISPLDSVITIGQIREIKKSIYWQPLESRKKIILIDDAHRMNTEASNSLLKILEEPPEFAVLILITAAPNILLPTIISRCSKLIFKPVIEEQQKKILARMNLSVDQKNLEKILLLSAGSPGKAIQLATEQWKMEKKNQYIDWLVKMKPEKMIYGIFESDREMTANTTNSFLDFIEIMVFWFRDILFLKIGLEQDKLYFSDRLEDLINFAKYYSQERLLFILEYLIEIPEKLEKHINQKTLLENILIQIGD